MAPTVWSWAGVCPATSRPPPDEISVNPGLFSTSRGAVTAALVAYPAAKPTSKQGQG